MACPTCDIIRSILDRYGVKADRLTDQVLASSGLLADDGMIDGVALAQRLSPLKPTFTKVAQEGVKAVRRATTKQKKQRKHMSQALKNVNKRAKLKNGNWRKGWDQSRCMKEAHKEAKRLCR